METLREWLEEKLKARGWKPADLARAARIPDATLSRVLTQSRNAGADVCLAIAKALNEPPEKVFRLAGLLPPLPGSEETTARIVDLLNRLPESEQQLIFELTEWRYQKSQEGKHNGG